MVWAIASSVPQWISATLYKKCSGCPVRRCPDARFWLIVAHFEHAAIRLRPGPGAPSGNERAGERGVEKIDRDGVIQQAAHSGRRHRPSVRAAIRVEPGGHLHITLPEAAERNADPDAGRETAFGHSDHLAGVGRRQYSRFPVRVLTRHWRRSVGWKLWPMRAS